MSAISAFLNKFEFLVKLKMAAMWAAILNDVTNTQQRYNP